MTVAALMTEPRVQFFGNDGKPLAGGKLYTYQAGTQIPKATYQASNMTAANTNPVILDSNGRASVWLDTSDYLYSITLTDANGVQIYTVDNIQGVGGGAPATVSAVPWVDAKDYDSFYACLVDIGSAKTTLVISTPIVTDSITVPSNVTLMVLQSGSITINPGEVLTIDGPFECGLYSAFSGTGTVAFGGVSTVSVEWFGGNFTYAIASLPTAGGIVSDSRTGSITQAGFTITRGVTVELGSALYTLTGAIQLDAFGRLHGRGAYNTSTGTRITTASAIGSLIKTSGNDSFNHGVGVRDIYVDAAYGTNSMHAGVNIGATSHGIELWTLGENSYVENIWVAYAAGSGVKLYGRNTPWYLRNISTFENAYYGLEIDCNTDGSSAGNDYLVINLSGDNNTLALCSIVNGSARSVLNFINTKSERRSASVQDPVFLVDNFLGSILINGIHPFNSSTQASAVIKLINSVAPNGSTIFATAPDITIQNAYQSGYDYWINDTVNTRTVPVAGGKLSMLLWEPNGPRSKFNNVNGYQEVRSNVSTGIHEKRFVTDEANPRFYSDIAGVMYWGAGGASATDTSLYRGGAGVIETTSSIKISGAAWNAGTLRLGAYYLWVDGSGRLRIKSSAPTSDTDGTIVGTQS